MERRPEFDSLSETSITVNLGKDASPEVHARIQSLLKELDQNPFRGYQEAVPSYIGVTVFYDPIMLVKTMRCRNVADEVIRLLKERIYLADLQEEKQIGEQITIPVCYDAEFGPDLDHVAKTNGLTREEVIDLHTAKEYLVYMIGFAPGFPFLGGMDERIATPRHGNPRTEIPAGSVGIAGKQTGVYPISTPGGWQLIGQTPLKLFSTDREVPSLLKAGDRVTFKAISKSEFLRKKEVDNGSTH